MLETEPQLIERYVRDGQVRLVYRHLLQLGAATRLVAEAAECAADQGRFWEMRLALYERQGQFFGDDARANLEVLAGARGLERAAFAACLDAQTHRAVIEADYQAAQAAGVRSRPEFQIGDQRIIGAQPFTILQAALDAALE